MPALPVFAGKTTKIAAVSFVSTIQPLLFDFLFRSCEIYVARTDARAVTANAAAGVMIGIDRTGKVTLVPAAV